MPPSFRNCAVGGLNGSAAAMMLFLWLTGISLAGQLTVTWEDNSSNETGFRIERSTDGKTFIEVGAVPANVTSFIDRDAPSGPVCWYRVAAYSSVGASAASNLAGINTALTSSFASSPSKLINLSARAVPGLAEKSLIVGFVVRGGDRSVLLRAVGPGLAKFTTTATVLDPILTVLDGNVVVSQNDNWDGSASLSSVFTQLGAFPLAAASRDAAMLSDFSAKGYTVLFTGADSGIGIAEIYDADRSGVSAGRLVNLSARAQVAGGDGVLIVGFVITGTKSMRVLLRAVGPGLSPLGVTTALADPQLDLYCGAVLLDHNDDWLGRPGLSSAFAEAGAFALPDSTSRDAAMVAFLPPGAYTAIVSGVNGLTGVALAEVYELP